MGLRAWLLGGSGVRRWPRRLPGRSKSCYAGGKRSSGGGLASPWKQAGPGGRAAFESGPGCGWTGGRGAGCAAGGPQSGVRVSRAAGGWREPRRESSRGSRAASHSAGLLFLAADPACGPPTATMVSKSDQLLIVVSILEGEWPGTWRLRLLLPEFQQ